jgi:putative ABC transport system permease protein
METVICEMRFAVRWLARQPGFACVVVLTLGLGIGANTAIFSFVNALLLRPFPFKDPDQLVQIHSVRGGEPGMISGRELLDLREQVTSLEAVAGHTSSAGGYNYSGEGRPEEWKAILTTGNLFEVLGVPLQVGGKWEETADQQRDFRVILTHGVWQRNFAGRPDVVGKRITLDHAEGYQIHGVAGRGFDYPRGVEVYRSIGGFTTYDRRIRRNLVAVARMKPGVSFRGLQSELDAFSNRLAAADPETNAGLSFRAVAFRELYSGDVRPYLLLLSGAVAFVLLIACANTVNLLLSRGLRRAREMGVRIALGARRGDLITQALAESAVLSLAAGAVGVGMAITWVELVRATIGLELPAWMVVELDARVLLFALALSLSAALLSGLAPALHFSRPAVVETLKESSRAASVGRGAGLLRDTMVVVEIALAVVLLSGAGLLIRAFLDLMNQDKGFRAESVLTLRVALGWKRYDSQDRIAGYYERALFELSRAPGIEAVGFGSAPPLARVEASQPNTVQAENQSLDEVRSNPYVRRQSVSENYFQLLGIPLQAGRFFDELDSKDGEPVVIVSERLAKILWGDRDAIGQRLVYNPPAAEDNPFRKVIGVVGNVHRELGGEPSLDLYTSYRQQAASNQYILARTRLGLGEFTRLAEQTLWSIDREQSVFDFQTYDRRILNSIWQLRLSRTLLLLFSVVALALAAVGTYGVMSYVVGQRRREMGIRLALGATPSSIRSLVLKRGLYLAAFGLGFGVAGAAALGRILENMFDRIPGGDPLSWVAPLVTLLVVTLAACALPAWRASRIDPAITLRDE